MPDLYRVTVSKVHVEDLEFSVWDGLYEAIARAGELTQQMGLENFGTISFGRSPVTGELITVVVTQEVESGT